jgi:hypothetical protein
MRKIYVPSLIAVVIMTGLYLWKANLGARSLPMMTELGSHKKAKEPAITKVFVSKESLRENIAPSGNLGTEVSAQNLESVHRIDPVQKRELLSKQKVF